MNDIKIKFLMEEAENNFSMAQKELCKPEEDVVHYMVCKGAYKSVYNYLTGYLHLHEVKPNPSNTIEELWKLSRGIDPKFDKLDLNMLYNAHEEEDVWMDMGTAQEFMDIASKTRELVKV